MSPIGAPTMPYHADPVEHAARHFDAQGAAADRQAALHEQMSDALISAIREGRTDEVMPYIHVPSDAMSVTDWVILEATAEDCARLMKVLHLALCGDNAKAIHEAAMQAVEPVAKKFADAYLLWRAE